MLRAFGNVARQWISSHCSADQAVTVCDAGAFPAAVANVIEERSAGSFRAAMVLFQDPRRSLLPSIYRTLTSGKSDDAFIAHMNAFASGGVNINGTDQNAIEAAPFGAAIRKHFRDLWALADVTLFRSAFELEMAVRVLGTRPTRVAFYAPIDSNVPAPPESRSEVDDTIAIWGVGIHPDLIDCALRSLFDVRLKPIVISSPENAAQTLARARVIMTLTEDPGNAVALSAYGRPLCAATHGAAEMLSNVQTFDIWSPAQLVDAVLRALRGLPPALREGSEPRLQPPLPSKAPPPDSTPLVSIVMTVYDRLESLRATLRALQKQTYPNIEIIVVSNNGPRADSVCAAFPNVRYIHRNENSGAAAAPRKDGIAAAKGTYITCLDDDDAYFPDHVERMVRICESGAKVVYGDFVLRIVERGKEGAERLLGYDMERGDGITAFELLVANRIGYMTVFAHREVYETVGTYDNVRMQGADEVELWMRMAQRYPFAHADCATAMYTVRKNWEGSLTKTEESRYADGYERMYAQYPSDGYPLISEQRRKYVAWLRSRGGEPPREPVYPAGT